MSNDVKLTSMTKSSGCAAKLGPGVLQGILEKLPRFEDKNLLVGFDTSDDACVYKINDTTVCIQTVDFFPPMVDDPYLFGQVAATNALSDIYAMGGDPALALNLICFPSCLDTKVLEEILAGGYSKVKEAGAVIAGGHSIADPTPKYGLCVTGFAHPSQVLSNSTAKNGDVLILTKPLGVGIMNTAAKAELLSAAQLKLMGETMTMLNKYAKEAANGLTINACTDVTGFGLLGHTYEMAKGSRKTITLTTNNLPVIPDALEFAGMGILPEGMYHNLDFLQDKVKIPTTIAQNMQDVLMDPQTSGGLLFSLPEKDAKTLLSRLEAVTPWARIIGHVTDSSEESITLI